MGNRRLYHLLISLGSPASSSLSSDRYPWNGSLDHLTTCSRPKLVQDPVVSLTPGRRSQQQNGEALNSPVFQPVDRVVLTYYSLQGHSRRPVGGGEKKSRGFGRSKAAADVGDGRQGAAKPQVKKAVFETTKKKEIGVSDLTLLSKISNDAINDNLKLRFEHGEIYVRIIYAVGDHVAHG